MNNNIPLLMSGICLALAIFKSNVLDSLYEQATRTSNNMYAWLISPDGYWEGFYGQLPYQDFYERAILTEDGYLWVGAEITKIPTDGYDYDAWQEIGRKLNRVYSNLPDKTSIQIISHISHNPAEVLEPLQRVALAAQQTGSPLLPVVTSRLKTIQQKSSDSWLKVYHTYVFIGRKYENKTKEVKKGLSNPLKALWSSDIFVQLEKAEFETLYNELLRTLKSFAGNYTEAGGKVRLLSAQQTYEMIYQGLNPGRSKKHPHSNIKKVSFDLPKDKAKGSNIKLNNKPYNELRADLFADNPRQNLCFTNAEVKGWYVDFEGELKATICLQTLPTRVFTGLMEFFTRSVDLNFDLTISTNFTSGNQYEWDERLEKESFWLEIYQRRPNPSHDVKWKYQEINTIREQTRRGEEKIGELRVAITFGAKNINDLTSHRDTILRLLRSLEGLEGIVESHIPIPSYISSLPCASNKDHHRQKVVLSRDAVALTPWTGANEGISPKEAVDVFFTPWGTAFYWNPRSEQFNAGMSLFCGGTGSGKSAALNRQRTVLLIDGHRGITIDFGGSAKRIAQAIPGSRYIDICDPSAVKGLNLFSIRVQPNEAFTKEQLLGERPGERIPLHRLAALETIMETLCLDPTKADITNLEPEESAVLKRYIRITYRNLVERTPTIKDFIINLENATPDDKEIAKKLALRLEHYADNGSLRHFLNDSGSQPMAVDHPYVVFDFGGAKNDPRLILVSIMAINNYIDRFIYNERSVKKFVDVDEFSVVTDLAQGKRIAKVIDLLVRTARKENTLVSISSQSPGDFNKNNDISNMRTNFEVLWLFQTNNLELAKQTFELSEGEQQALSKLQNGGENHRDCLLLYPSSDGRRGCAHLRIVASIVDKRLLMAGGKERSTIEECLKEQPNLSLHASLYQAILGSRYEQTKS